MEYAAEIWGDEHWKEGEGLQSEMGRRILRCSPFATIAAIRGDLGWWSLRSRRDLKKLIYFCHILSLPEERLLKQAYFMSRDSGRKVNWAGRIKKILAKYGLQAVWEDERKIWDLDGMGNGGARNEMEHQRFIKNFLYKQVLATEEKEWWKEVEKKSKLRTYRLLKSRHLRLEKYLLTSGYYFGRTLMSDLRIGTNKLEIEQGRKKVRTKEGKWEKGKSKEERICRQCISGEVEDELHFVTKCTRFAEVRQSLFDGIRDLSGGKWKLSELPASMQFKVLMSGSGDVFEGQIFQVFQGWLVKSFKRRI